MISIGRKLEKLINIGDNVICIDIEKITINIEETTKVVSVSYLTLGNSYKIIDIRTENSIPLYYLIRDDRENTSSSACYLSYYDINCFVSIQEYREQQIDKVLK